MVDSTPYSVGPAVDDHVDAISKHAFHVLRARRAQVAERICTWRGEGHGGTQKELPRNGMRRHAHCDGRQPGSHEAWYLLLFLQHQRQRSGPKRIDEPARIFRHARHDGVQHGFVDDVHDQRIERRTGLDFKDARNGCRVKRAGAEAVNGFGWERDNRAAA